MRSNLFFALMISAVLSACGGPKWGGPNGLTQKEIRNEPYYRDCVERKLIAVNSGYSEEPLESIDAFCLCKFIYYVSIVPKDPTDIFLVQGYVGDKMCYDGEVPSISANGFVDGMNIYSKFTRAQKQRALEAGWTGWDDAAPPPKAIAVPTQQRSMQPIPPAQPETAIEVQQQELDRQQAIWKLEEEAKARLRQKEEEIRRTEIQTQHEMRVRQEMETREQRFAEQQRLTEEQEQFRRNQECENARKKLDEVRDAHALRGQDLESLRRSTEAICDATTAQ